MPTSLDLVLVQKHNVRNVSMEAARASGAVLVCHSFDHLVETARAHAGPRVLMVRIEPMMLGISDAGAQARLAEMLAKERISNALVCVVPSSTIPPL